MPGRLIPVASNTSMASSETTALLTWRTVVSISSFVFPDQVLSNLAGLALLARKNETSSFTFIACSCGIANAFERDNGSFKDMSAIKRDQLNCRIADTTICLSGEMSIHFLNLLTIR